MMQFMMDLPLMGKGFVWMVSDVGRVKYISILGSGSDMVSGEKLFLPL